MALSSSFTAYVTNTSRNVPLFNSCHVRLKWGYCFAVKVQRLKAHCWCSGETCSFLERRVTVQCFKRDWTSITGAPHVKLSFLLVSIWPDLIRGCHEIQINECEVSTAEHREASPLGPCLWFPGTTTAESWENLSWSKVLCRRKGRIKYRVMLAISKAPSASALSTARRTRSPLGLDARGIYYFQLPNGPRSWRHTKV